MQNNINSKETSENPATRPPGPKESINTAELRRGNYLLWKGKKLVQVKYLNEERISIETHNRAVWSFPLSIFSYVPITDEILVKIEFYPQTQKTYTGFTRYCGNRMMLLVDHSENPFSNIELYYERHLAIYECLGQRTNLKLHQLQNITYFLTGKELEIKELNEV